MDQDTSRQQRAQERGGGFQSARYSRQHVSAAIERGHLVSLTTSCTHGYPDLRDSIDTRQVRFLHQAVTLSGFNPGVFCDALGGIQLMSKYMGHHMYSDEETLLWKPNDEDNRPTIDTSDCYFVWRGNGKNKCLTHD